MKIFHNLAEWQATRRTLTNHLSLGFVPTMGNLHRGHASLVRASQQENERTAVSIFINPTQFNRANDFTHYPRTLDDDLALLQDLQVDYCLLPNEKDMYADGFQYQLQENNHSMSLEGEHRPGHFTGVLTVVMKLLNLTTPHRAYFGEKDYQQLQLIRGMVDAFFINTEIKGCPTVRESSGLAYSSRNNRLTAAQRSLAGAFAQIFHQPSLSLTEILAQLRELDLNVEYLEEQEGRRFVAVNLGDVRLIDNYATMLPSFTLGT